MDHISDDWLERYAKNTLPESQLGIVEEHLLICPECQDRLQETEEFISAMRAAAERLEADDGE